MTKRPRQRKGSTTTAHRAESDDRPEVMRDESGALVRRTYEDDETEERARLDEWATQMQAGEGIDFKKRLNSAHGKESVGGASSAELKKAAERDGATFVQGSSRARPHVRSAPPSERKPGDVKVPDGAKVGAPTRVLIGSREGIEELPAVYALVEVDSLVTSHDPSKSFAIVAAYPVGVQERRYHQDKYEQLKVLNNAARLVPAYLITDNPDSVNGPPVVDASGVVLGGNSRAMSLRLAYPTTYRALLVERAKVFGFAPTALDGMEYPTLVRVVVADVERYKDLSRRLNEAQTQEKDVNADAVSLAHRLSPEALSLLAAEVSPDETLNAYLASTRARGFVRRLYHDGVITQQAGGRLLVGADLSEEGRSVVARVVVAKLVPDATLIERMGAQLRDVVARTAPGLVKAQQAGHDLAPSLVVALEDLSDAQARGLSIERLTAQGSMFAETQARARTHESQELRFMLAGSPTTAVRVLRRFAALAVESPAGQNVLFGESPTTAALLDSAIAAEKRGGQ